MQTAILRESFQAFQLQKLEKVVQMLWAQALVLFLSLLIKYWLEGVVRKEKWEKTEYPSQDIACPNYSSLTELFHQMAQQS